MTFKQELYQIAQEVATEFAGWTFTAKGEFRSPFSKDTDLAIDPRFYFHGDSCSMTLYVKIFNKKFNKLNKKIFNQNLADFNYQFSEVDSKYRVHGRPSHFYRKWVGFYTKGVFQELPPGFHLLPEAKQILRQIMQDGLRYIDEYLDLSSEVNLFRNLPLTRKPQDYGPDVAYGHFYKFAQTAVTTDIALGA